MVNKVTENEAKTKKKWMTWKVNYYGLGKNKQEKKKKVNQEIIAFLIGHAIDPSICILSVLDTNGTNVNRFELDAF